MKFINLEQSYCVFFFDFQAITLLIWLLHDLLSKHSKVDQTYFSEKREENVAKFNVRKEEFREKEGFQKPLNLRIWH